MNFLSIYFIAFVFITLVAYYVVPKKFQWIVLLAASLSFYLYTGKFSFIYVLITSVSTYFAGKKVQAINLLFVQKKKEGLLSKDELKVYKNQLRSKKRVILVLLLVLNFGILAALKYWNTIIGAIDSKTNADLSFLLLNHGKHLLLPLGISFYTFQSVAYFMDVYNSKFEAEKNYFKFLLFISFFPQLLQGPINRYDKTGQELISNHDFDIANIKEGSIQFLYGAFKEYAIAACLVNFISKIFDAPYNNLPGSVIVFGILLYSVYQYADFSGGIDMVLGIAKMFGIHMQPNFRQPYFSISLGDFWRRWHISLGLWMKDYVFYPFVLTEGMQKLSKKCNKLGKHFARTIPAGISNLLVFLIVGIWHGPEFHYVLWGLYNGLVIALSDLLKPVFTKINEKLHIKTASFGWKVFQIIRTFIIVNIGWYFDRIYDVKKSFVYLKNTFTSFNISQFKECTDILFTNIRNPMANFAIAGLCSAIVFVISLIAEKQNGAYNFFNKQKTIVQWIIIYFFIAILILSFCNPNEAVGFMYANY